MTTFKAIADEITRDIAEGRLRAGDQLPPQRDFAWKRQIAASTASRVYAELVKRGLATGEVGRGTFIRAAPPLPGAALTEPAAQGIDMELNVAILPWQAEQMADSLQALMRADAFGGALQAMGTASTPGARETVATFLARPGWVPEPASLLFAGNGKQAIAAALSAIAPTGGRIGVEALTYPVVKGLAARLGINLVPLAMDDEGLLPEAVRQAHVAAPLCGLYLQPHLHNPLGVSMGAQRKAALAAVLTETGLPAIEDAIYAFLVDDAPLAAWAPEATILVDSLSKRLAPGLTLGFLCAPAALKSRLATALRSGAWMANGYPLAAALRWMADGTAARITEAKRADAAGRQQLARRILGGLALRGDPRAYHLWLELPGGWRAESYAAAAARSGVAVTPASAFAIGAGHAPNAVRLALASPPLDALERALLLLRDLAATGGEGDRPLE